MRIATTKPTGKQMTTVVATAAICIMAFACRTAFAAATTPVPDGLVDLTTASSGYFAAYYSSSHKTYPMDKAFDNGSKTAGLAIESEGYDLGITNCKFNVTPGATISVTGGGTMTFTDTTVNLAERPTSAFTFAETDGTFSGLPTLSGARGWRMRMSSDASRISIVPLGFMMIVR